MMAAIVQCGKQNDKAYSKWNSQEDVQQNSSKKYI